MVPTTHVPGETLLSTVASGPPESRPALALAALAGTFALALLSVRVGATTLPRRRADYDGRLAAGLLAAGTATVLAAAALARSGAPGVAPGGVAPVPVGLAGPALGGLALLGACLTLAGLAYAAGLAVVRFAPPVPRVSLAWVGAAAALVWAAAGLASTTAGALVVAFVPPLALVVVLGRVAGRRLAAEMTVGFVAVAGYAGGLRLAAGDGGVVLGPGTVGLLAAATVVVVGVAGVPGYLLGRELRGPGTSGGPPTDPATPVGRQ